jgi:uncharacterized protein involved in exopolysaccharide biosynthesis
MYIKQAVEKKNRERKKSKMKTDPLDLANVFEVLRAQWFLILILLLLVLLG